MIEDRGVGEEKEQYPLEQAGCRISGEIAHPAFAGFFWTGGRRRGFRGGVAQGLAGAGRCQRAPLIPRGTPDMVAPMMRPAPDSRPFLAAPLLAALAVLLALAAPACVSFHRAIRIPNVYRVMDGGHAAMEQRTREHLEFLLTSEFFKRRGLTFGGDVVLKPVPAVRKDARGVPFYTSLREKARDRSGGLTLFTGRERPVIIVIAVLPDGTWDDRTLKHEAAHAILLWNGISGHPPKFRGVVPLWD
jgi:hypothetical protein